MAPTRRIACLAVLCTAAVVAAGLSRGVLGVSASRESTSSITTATAEVRRLIAAGSADLVEVAMEANRLFQPPGVGPAFIPIETRRIAFHVPAIAVRFLDLRDPYGSYRIGFGLWSRTLDPVRADELADLAEHCPRGNVMSCPGWEVRQAARVRDGERALRIEMTSIIGVPERRHAVLRSRSGHDKTGLLDGPCEVSWDASLGMLVGRPPEGSPPGRACGGIAQPSLSDRDREIVRQRLQATFLKLDAAGQPRFVVLCTRGVEDRTAAPSGNCELQGYFGEWPLFFWVANNRADEWEAIHDRLQDFLARHLAPGTLLREGER